MIEHDDETCSWNFDYQKRRDAIQQNVETRYNKMWRRGTIKMWRRD